MESDHFYYPENFDKIVASYDTLPEAIVCGNDMIAQKIDRVLPENRCARAGRCGADRV